MQVYTKDGWEELNVSPCPKCGALVPPTKTFLTDNKQMVCVGCHYRIQQKYEYQPQNQRWGGIWCSKAHPIRKSQEGDTKMTTLREEAKKYEPPQTYNIADLDKVAVDIDLKDGKGKDGNGEEFTYKFIMLEGKEYRVPGSVIGGLKAIIAKMPSVQYVSVIKQGQGMNTRYTVLPITAEEKVD
jgi:hypothetical protein